MTEFSSVVLLLHIRHGSNEIQL